MKKSSAVGVRIVSAVSSLALALGCGTRTPTHQKACGDDRGLAVEAEKCDEEESKSEQARRHGHPYAPLYHWYYGGYGRSYAPGTALNGFSRDIPTGKVRIAEPVRGGFGGSARPQYGG